MKNIITGLMIGLFALTSTYGADCASDSCVVARLPRRIVTLSKEVVSVPVEVTSRTVTRVRRFGRRLVVKNNGCDCATTVQAPASK